MVATVDLRDPRVTRCSMATVGGMPVSRSTAGRGNCSTNCRAYGDIDSMNRRWPSANTMSKARGDLPDPETPVTTLSGRWGIVSERLLRLFALAPRIPNSGLWILDCGLDAYGSA